MIGRIYKIVHSQSDLVYIGMTINSLTKRWQSHKCSFDKDDSSKISIYEHMRFHGVNEFKIMLIKEYDVIDKQHLKVYESLWINKLKCVNRVPSFNPMNKKQRDRMSYIKNRESRLVKVHEYAAANKDLIVQRNKAYREKNKDDLKLKKSKAYICECGGKYQEAHKQRHFRTKKHQDWLATQS